MPSNRYQSRQIHPPGLLERPSARQHPALLLSGALPPWIAGLNIQVAPLFGAEPPAMIPYHLQHFANPLEPTVLAYLNPPKAISIHARIRLQFHEPCHDLTNL